MKENFWYRDPLASGHAAADRILEKRKQEAEMEEADLRSDIDKEEEVNSTLATLESEEKENPSEEYYGRFEQFKGVKKHPDVPAKNKKDNNKKGPGSWPPHRNPRAFDPYK